MGKLHDMEIASRKAQGKPGAFYAISGGHQGYLGMSEEDASSLLNQIETLGDGEISKISGRLN